MRNDVIADPMFDINDQAMAVMHMLHVEPDFAEYDERTRSYKVNLSTFPFYNGRERAIGLMMWRPECSHAQFVVVFGECRNSDSIFVDSWFMPRTMNPPTVADFSEDIYKQRWMTRYGHILAASQHVYELLAQAYTRLKQEKTQK